MNFISILSNSLHYFSFCYKWFLVYNAFSKNELGIFDQAGALSHYIFVLLETGNQCKILTENECRIYNLNISSGSKNVPPSFVH